MESTWEIAINERGDSDPSVKELPHMIKVTGLSFIPIQKFVPAKADDLLNPTQKYIALTNGFTDNYEDEYSINYQNPGEKNTNTTGETALTDFI